MTENSSLQIYLEHIRRYPLLTFEQEIDLARRIQNGDKEAESLMINSNLRLVVRIARRYTSSDFPLMDVIQEGNIGLMTAVKKFKADFEVRFSTYACWWIRQTISRSLNNKKRIIRLPHRKEELLKHIQKAFFEFQNEEHRNPSVAELSELIGTNQENITELIGYLSPTYSLDAEIEDSEKSTFIDMFVDNTYNPECSLMKEIEQNATKAFVNNVLKKRDKSILMERLNLSCRLKPKTLKDLGYMYGISAETVRQIEMRAIKKLQKHSSELTKAIS